MSITHLLRINTDGEPTALYQFDAHSNSCHEHAVDGWSDASLKAAELIIIVPAQWVYQTRTQVASKNDEILKKSIPFAVEEELSNELEDNFFAYQLQSDGSQQVVAIQQQPLITLHQNIMDLGLKVAHIYSEHAWLPADEQLVHVWMEQTGCLIRFGLNQTMLVAPSQVAELVPVFAAEGVQLVSNAKLTLPDHPIKRPLKLADCARQVVQGDHIDLWVDELKHQRQEQRQSSWRVVWLLAAVVLISWLGIRVFQYQQLNDAVVNLQQQQQNILLSAFPDAAEVELNDPFAAIKSRLQRLTGQQQQPAVLLDAVHGIGQVSQQQTQVALRGLRLSNGVLEIQILAPSMSVINQFHQALQNTLPQYRVLIGVNELGDDNQFKSILTMEAR